MAEYIYFSTRAKTRQHFYRRRYNGGEKIHMCRAIDILIKDGEKRGEKRGFRLGSARERKNTERERKNTERERKRAEQERKRAETAEARVRELERMLKL